MCESDAFLLLISEANDLRKVVKGLDAWCYKRRNTDPQDPKFCLLVYAEGLRDGMARVLKKMGVSLETEAK